MPQVPINYLALIVATASSMAIGFLWYGPLFGKTWMALSGITPDKVEASKAKGMGKVYALNALGALVMSYILAHALVFANAYLHSSGLSSGVMVGFLNWLGFIAPVTLGPTLWEGKSWKVWFLNSGYYLVSLIIMGSILALW
ncbi:MAG: DUF1761 domain-containing protein [Candidatus Liptonbacteria bacterium]|nr:DUF1761 domain-containing protein [Candidatus Liptonbacteria bacterium]